MLIPLQSLKEGAVSVLPEPFTSSLARWVGVVNASEEETEGRGVSPSSDHPVLPFPTSGHSGEVKIMALHHGDHSYPGLCASE